MDGKKLASRLEAIAPRAKGPSLATAKREAARSKWLERHQVPAVLVAADPGAISGSSIIVPDRRWRPHVKLAESFSVWDSKRVDAVLERAMDEGGKLGLDVVLVCETWGAGGIMGINSWLGLGEARGVWKAAFLRHGGKQKHIAHIDMNTWRGAMILETGHRDETGKFTRWDTDGWKQQATRTLAELTGHRIEIPSADAGEAGLIGLYAARAERVFDALGKRYIAARSWPAWAD